MKRQALASVLAGFAIFSLFAADADAGHRRCRHSRRARPQRHATVSNCNLPSAYTGCSNSTGYSQQAMTMCDDAGYGTVSQANADTYQSNTVPPTAVRAEDRGYLNDSTQATQPEQVDRPSSDQSENQPTTAPSSDDSNSVPQ